MSVYMQFSTLYPELKSSKKALVREHYKTAMYLLDGSLYLEGTDPFEQDPGVSNFPEVFSISCYLLNGHDIVGCHS